MVKAWWQEQLRDYTLIRKQEGGRGGRKRRERHQIMESFETSRHAPSDIPL